MITNSQFHRQQTQHTHLPEAIRNNMFDDRLTHFLWNGNSRNCETFLNYRTHVQLGS